MPTNKLTIFPVKLDPIPAETSSFLQLTGAFDEYLNIEKNYSA